MDNWYKNLTRGIAYASLMLTSWETKVMLASSTRGTQEG